MSLVEAFAAETGPVPGLSLLQNKTFRASGGGAVRALPSVVHFGGFQTDKTHTVTLARCGRVALRCC